MKRILVFLLSFLGVAVVLLGSILLVNRGAFRTLFENREGMMEGREWVQDTYSLRGLVDYVENNPERVTIVSRVLGAPDSLLSLNADVPRPLGTLSNLFVLAAVAEAFESGELDPAEAVDWAQVSAWQIPKVSEQPHVALGNLLADEGEGEAVDGSAMEPGTPGLTLERAAGLLAEHGDLALSDYLLNRVGRDRVGGVMRRTGMRTAEVPAPFAGLYLLASWSQQGAMSGPVGEFLAQEVPDADPAALREALAVRAPEGGAPAGTREPVWLEWADRLGKEFASGSERSAEWREKLEQERLGLSFMQERDALGLFPMVRAAELADGLELIWQGVAPSPASAEKVVEWLSWPTEESTIRRDFTRYGALYDNRMGLLGGIDFGTSRYTGQSTVQVVLFDRLPIAFWFHLSANHMHQDYQQRLIYDPALIETTSKALDRIARRSAPTPDPRLP